MNEVRKYNIKVSNFAPAAIETEWAQKAGIELPGDIKFLQPEDVAKVAQLIIEAPADLSIWNIDFIAMQHSIDPM
jgi:short-subunit dehydrogenase